jgi:hypothetical protein
MGGVTEVGDLATSYLLLGLLEYERRGLCKQIPDGDGSELRNKARLIRAEVL